MIHSQKMENNNLATANFFKINTRSAYQKKKKESENN